MNSTNIDDICRRCPGALLGDCEACRDRENGDEPTAREREDDYRELCGDLERDDGEYEEV